MPHSLALVYWYGIRTRMLQYIPRSTSPTTFHSMAHLSLHEYKCTTSLCTALASAVYTLCHLPIKPIIIHILISISHSAAPNIVYCITVLNTYVISLLRYISPLFCYIYVNCA
ncbi:BEM_collapsed_G0049580.mRNA.1.CDS.1 [Saccharomyces cerevisiae]|nr:BEM_collapsed_G0049580.mRNA.1.CDS.1 [Saccharomyces cerevisiae]